MTVSDGQLTYTATTSTANGSLGNWSIEGIGTPSRYVVRISSNGFGTEVISTDLGPGEARTTLSTELTVGVGSITGVVQAGGVGLGGAVITVSAGDTAVTTTTLTQGVPGAFSLPRLPVGIEYTLEVQADGRLTQTQTVFVGSAVDGVEINLLEDSGGAQGTVTNDQGASLGDVRVTIRSDTLSFETTTESTEGRWQVSGVPPGEYQVVFQRFNHLTAFGNITISAGASTHVPDPVLVFSTDPVLAANATLTGVLVNNRGQRSSEQRSPYPVTIRLCLRRAVPTGATKSTASNSVAIGFELPPCRQRYRRILTPAARGLSDVHAEQHRVVQSDTVYEWRI